MVKLEYVRGDLFEHEPPSGTIIAHVVNNVGAWGRGFVVPLAEHYPLAKRQYLMDHSTYRLGDTQFVRRQPADSMLPTTIANMFAQVGTTPRGHHYYVNNDKRWRQTPKVSYGYLGLAMSSVYTFARSSHYDNIYAPAFGAGLGGGDWEVIEQLINDLWVDRNINVTVFTLD